MDERPSWETQSDLTRPQMTGLGDLWYRRPWIERFRIGLRPAWGVMWITLGAGLAVIAVASVLHSEPVLRLGRAIFVGSFLVPAGIYVRFALAYNRAVTDADPRRDPDFSGPSARLPALLELWTAIVFFVIILAATIGLLATETGTSWVRVD